jgi:hypothetical protein
MIQGLSRSGASRPDVRRRRACLICSRIGCVALSPPRLCISLESSRESYSSSRTSPSRRMLLQSPSATAPNGHRRTSNCAEFGSISSTGTTSESTGSPAVVSAGAVEDALWLNRVSDSRRGQSVERLAAPVYQPCRTYPVKLRLRQRFKRTLYHYPRALPPVSRPLFPNKLNLRMSLASCGLQQTHSGNFVDTTLD